jgi:fatty-acyl-CoA synthase
MQTLDGRIAAAARAPGGITFVSGGRASDQAVRVPWSELYAEATARAGALAAMGARPGVHVGVLGPTTVEHVTLLQAVWRTGATLVVLPLPMRLSSIDEFVAQTRRRIHHADLAMVLVDPEFLPFFAPEPGDPPVHGYDEVGRAPFAAPDIDPDSLALIQFTSGSTADPKAVTLPHRTVCANLDAIATAAAMDPTDEVMVSWLPLYHDMGLVGFLILPMTTGCELVLGAPQDFLASPLRWLRWLSDHGGTATAGPNFAWVLATRALQRLGADERLDLSRLRIALNGAEPVDATAVEEFIAAAEPHGLRPGAVFPAFGMAEVVIGATFPEPMSGLRVDHVDPRALEERRVAVPVATAEARRLVRLGRPLPGLEIRIVDEATGEVLPERAVGELEIRGSSVTPGYYRRDDLAGELFRDGWLRTGDLAYLVDGELVVCGRSKDVIIVGGRNIFPDDIERAVSAIEGVRAGNVMAFGVDGRQGKESIVVVCEVRTDDETLLHKHVAERVREVVGVPAKDIVFVAPSTLPKTSSGKLQRAECRARYLAGRL